MGRPIIKFLTDFGPLLIFFTVYFKNEQDLKIAIPPFVLATLIALVVIYVLERKIPMVQMMRNEALKAFELWDKKKDKVKY